MSTEIERYQPAAPPTVFTAPTELDQWVLVVQQVGILANQIADTEFVPVSYRGNSAAVTAAILTGREMGVGPMTALQHIHVIKGRPGQSAQMMRAMVLAAGHEIRDLEVTETRVVLEGKRRGEERWARVMFTADQARRAKIDLGGYPEDKLYARATTRLCRRIFADVIGGLAYAVEELEDGEIHDDVRLLPSGGGEDQAPAEPAKRTAKRKTATRPPAKSAPPPSTSPAAAEPASAGPPLPGEDGYEETGGRPTDQQPAAAESVTNDQLTKLHVQLGEFGIDDRADKLTTVSLLARRELVSSKDLTKAEASGVIELLEKLLDSDDPSKALNAALAAFESEEDGAT